MRKALTYSSFVPWNSRKEVLFTKNLIFLKKISVNKNKKKNLIHE